MSYQSASLPKLDVQFLQKTYKRLLIDRRETSVTRTTAVGSPRSVLSSLKNRNTPRKEEIPTDQVMEVIQKYVIPMFERDQRASTSRHRATVMGLASPRQLDGFPGSVFGELKLSERLKAQVDDLNKRFSAQTALLADTKQEITQLLKEKDKLTQDSTRQQVENETLRYRMDSLTQEVQSEALKTEAIHSQLAEYRNLVRQLTEEAKALKECNYNQSALNDKWKNKALILKSENTLLLMEITVKAEHLKGLYEAIGRVLAYPALTDQLRLEVKSIHSSFLEIRESNFGFSEKLEKLMGLKDNAEQQFKGTLELYETSTSARDKQIRSMHSKLQQLTANLEAALDEKTHVEDEFKELDKRHNVLAQEYEMLRGKIKQIRVKRRVVGELQEEQNCKLCGKAFFETENFAWSCRLHKSEYGGQIWWCCGKEGKDAIGCQNSKHIPNDDEDKLIDQVNDRAKVKTCLVRPR